MARTRAFDEALALDGAMHQFWAAGYHGSSLASLLAATGLSKSSLYDTFHSKRALLLEALARYERFICSESPIAPVMRPGAGRADIESALRDYVSWAASADGRYGCFANNCIAEIGPHDAEVRRAATAITGRIEQAFHDAIARGQAAGDIQRRDPPRTLARFLLNNVAGLSLAAKSAPDRDRLDDIVGVALHSLD